MSRHVGILFALAAASALAAPARAHEPPHGIRLLWREPRVDAMPVVLTNRGIVYPDASGGSVHRLRCNEGYGALSSARPEAMLDDRGALVIATTQAVERTSDQACSFTASTGLPTSDQQAALDLSLGGFAQDPSAPARALVSTQVYKSAAQVWLSQDYARSWSVLSTNQMYSVYRALRIAHDGQHVLASGQRYDMSTNKLLAIYGYSADGGETWTDVDVPAERAPLGFLPNDASVCFMREQIPNRSIAPADHLLRSSDGGKTFEMVGGEWPSLDAFTATPDGQTVWLSSRLGGVFRSDDAGKSFARLLPGTLNGADCLYYRQDVLWACANMAPNSDGIWTSSDLGASFKQVMVFNQVSAQVQCEDMAICELPWRDWSYELLDGWSSNDAGVVDDAGGVDDAGKPPAAPRAADGCALAPESSMLSSFALAVLLALCRRRARPQASRCRARR